VRGPKHSVKRGKTPVLSSVQARQLLDSIDVSTIVGLRDRALIALLVYNGAMARPSALGYLFSATCCFLSFLSTG
jgi:site-specific recombinase XerD